MSTKKSKMGKVLAVALTLGVLCAGTGLFASNNAKVDSENLNHKNETHMDADHKTGNHKNKQHQEAKCKDNGKKNCSQDQCDK
jgi:hypothetical protein